MRLHLVWHIAKAPIRIVSLRARTHNERKAVPTRVENTAFALIVFAAVVGGIMTIEGVIESGHGQGCAALTCFTAEASVLSPCQFITPNQACIQCKVGHKHFQNSDFATWRERALTGSCSCCMEGNSSGAIQGSVPRMFPLTKVAAFFLDSPKSPILTTGLLRSLKSHSRLSHFRSKWTTRRECRYSIPENNSNNNSNDNNNNADENNNNNDDNNNTNENAFQLGMS